MSEQAPMGERGPPGAGDAVPSESPSGPGNGKRKQRKRRPRKKGFGFIPRLVLALILGLGIGMAVIGVIVVPEFQRKEAAKGPQTEADRRAEEEKRKKAEAKRLRNENINLARKWEGPATQMTYHCKYLDQYFKEAGDLPEAELLGLAKGAGQVEVWKRCDELYGFVRMMGGWPSSDRPQDNFIVCEGFNLVVTGAGRLDVSLMPRSEDLVQGKLSYGVPGQWTRKQDIPTGYAQVMHQLAPLVTRIDGRCIVASLPRSRKTGKILGKIVRPEKEGE